MKGNSLDAIYDCPFEMHELVTDEDISRAIFKLNDAQKELLYQLAIKGYSCQLIATFRALTDRNIRKIRDTIINVNIKMYIFDHLRMYIFAILPLDRYIFLSDKIFP